MGLFDHFPYTNVHELNLDWILSMMRALEAEWESFTAGNSLTFADPLQHDISKTYAKNTIVLDGNGNAYVSVKAVPVGVPLSNSEYWLMVFDYEAFIEKVNKNFTANYYRGQYRATSAMAIGDWLTVDDILYKATAAIAVDDILEDGVNITHFTLEDFIKAFMQSANDRITQMYNDFTAAEARHLSDVQAEINRILAGATVDSEVIDARLGADGVNYPTLGDAIRTQFGMVAMSELSAGAYSGDFDDLIINGVMAFTDFTGATNAPPITPTLGGTLIIHQGAMNQLTGNGVIQLFLSRNSTYYFRMKWANAWTDWQSVAAAERTAMSQTGNATSFSGDFDDLTDNQYIAFSNITGSSNYPDVSLGYGGTLIVIRGVLGAANQASCVQMFISHHDKTFNFRIKWGSGWCPWEQTFTIESGADTPTGKRFPLSNTATAASFTGDFDDLTDNQYTAFTDLTGSSNHPDVSLTKGGTLIVIRGVLGNANEASCVQLFISAYDMSLNFRIKWGSTPTWTVWQKTFTLEPSANLPTGGRFPISKTGGSSAFTGDFDDLTDNMYTAYTNLTGATNAPPVTAGYGGVLMVIRGLATGTAGYVQIFVSPKDKDVCFRVKWGGAIGWTPWQTIKEQYADECYYASLSQFLHIGVIGDSIESGYIYPDGHTPGTDKYELSWPSNIARRNGVDVLICAKGGLYTKSWLTSDRGLSYMNSNDAQNLYLICLGENDQKKINDEVYTLGDTTDYTSRTDTFYGNYGTIIDSIRTKAPDAKIVLCTVSMNDPSLYEDVNTAIKTIAGIESLPVLDITQDPFLTSSFFSSSITIGHPTAASYSGYAMMIERQFSKCCVSYPSYFKTYFGN